MHLASWSSFAEHGCLTCDSDAFWPSTYNKVVNRLWRPMFSSRFINPNDRVKRVDFGQTTVNLGHHLETSPITPSDPPWSTLGQEWSNPSQNPLKPILPSFVIRNFCRVLQISPKRFKLSQCKSCVVCWGIQLSCWVAFEIWSANLWKSLVHASGYCSEAPRKQQCWHTNCAQMVEKNIIPPL
jgi:hypothetical protein